MLSRLVSKVQSSCRSLLAAGIRSLYPVSHHSKRVRLIQNGELSWKLLFKRKRMAIITRKKPKGTELNFKKNLLKFVVN